MPKRRGLAPIQLVLVLLLVIVVGAGAISSFESSESVQSALDKGDAENSTSSSDPTPEPQFYHVSEMTLNGSLIPLGRPLEVTTVLTKVSGDDPFPVQLSVSGDIVEERQVNFGESDEVTETFIVLSDRQGIFEVHMGGWRQGFEVREEPPLVEWVEASPRNVEPNTNVTISFGVRNLNWAPVNNSVYIELIPMNYHYPVILEAREFKELRFNFSREWSGKYTVRINGIEDSFNISGNNVEVNVGNQGQEKEFVYIPIDYIPDPLTWNMTSLLPPNASPLRLSLPVPIDSLYGSEWAGIGGIGIHAGGHFEGLDHAWIESTTDEPVKSWADGEVTEMSYDMHGDQREYHITIEYGFNLTGIHMEIMTPLVEVGDIVQRGDPVGYGMRWFDGLQSAEHTLIDAGRRDGIRAGDGVYVSPFDYLEEPERIALADAYIKNVIEPYMESGVINGEFHPSQPYFTNNLLIHYGHEGRLQGEWYLISQNWTSGYPNDFITIIEPDNKYTDQPIIMGLDDYSVGDINDWTIKSDLHIDYVQNRLWFNDRNGKKVYGIFEVDESEERAKLKLQYQKGGYPTGFTDEALLYIERSYVQRRQDASELGVLDFSFD